MHSNRSATPNLVLERLPSGEPAWLRPETTPPPSDWKTWPRFARTTPVPSLSAKWRTFARPAKPALPPARPRPIKRPPAVSPDAMAALLAAVKTDPEVRSALLRALQEGAA